MQRIFLCLAIACFVIVLSSMFFIAQSKIDMHHYVGVRSILLHVGRSVKYNFTNKWPKSPLLIQQDLESKGQKNSSKTSGMEPLLQHQ